LIRQIGRVRRSGNGWRHRRRACLRRR
jgi:hypothetical protein